MPQRKTAKKKAPSVVEPEAPVLDQKDPIKAEKDIEAEKVGLKRLWDDEEVEVTTRAHAANVRKAVSAAPKWADPVHDLKKKKRERQALKKARMEDNDEDDDPMAASESDDDDVISEEEAYDEVFQQTGSLLDNKSGRIAPGALDYQRLKDANEAEYAEAALSAVNFHPAGSLLLTASPDHKLRIFQVDGVSSTKVQSIHFEALPLRNAQFTPDGLSIVCTGARPSYAVVDVESSKVTMVNGFGRDERNLSKFAVSREGNMAFCSITGSVHVVSPNTHHVVYSLKGDGPCNAAAFDGNQLFTTGGGKVYVWDVRTRRPLRIHADEGSMECTALAVSSGNYAVGSANGVVNVYDKPEAWGKPLDPAPTPRKGIMSLTTETTFCNFSPEGDGAQLLAIGSKKKKNAVRLVHVETLTVFNNFPRVGNYFRKLTCCSFANETGFLCLGNDRGRAMLFRVKK